MPRASIPVEFRLVGRRIALKTPDDPLEAGERRLAIIEVTVLQASALFNDDDCQRDALLLFKMSYHKRPDGLEDSVVDTADFHEVVLDLRLLIVGAALGASVFCV